MTKALLCPSRSFVIGTFWSEGGPPVPRAAPIAGPQGGEAWPVQIAWALYSGHQLLALRLAELFFVSADSGRVQHISHYDESSAGSLARIFLPSF